MVTRHTSNSRTRPHILYRAESRNWSESHRCRSRTSALESQTKNCENSLDEQRVTPLCSQICMRYCSS